VVAVITQKATPISNGGINNYKLERACNRGGTSFTSEQLEYSRFAIENILAINPDVLARNCSTGLEIKGCKVIISKMLNL
jgi:hypothetical protein